MSNRNTFATSIKGILIAAAVAVCAPAHASEAGAFIGFYPNLSSQIGNKFNNLLSLIRANAPPILTRCSVVSRWISVGRPWTGAAPC